MRAALLALALAACVGEGGAAEPAPPTPRRGSPPAPSGRGDLIAVKAGSLIDGRGGPPLAGPVVIVRGDRIEAVGQRLAVPAGARVIDLGPGATLLPGLIDLHTHLTSE